eukprot:6191040-Pleurochrysis_carterae.AAC.1
MQRDQSGADRNRENAIIGTKPLRCASSIPSFQASCAMYGRTAGSAALTYAGQRAVASWRQLRQDEVMQLQL